jgi:hypothetical protein
MLVKGDPPPYRTQYLDFGPEYLTSGVIAHHPPKPGTDYIVLVPKPDSDGNDCIGLKMPWVAVPLGAFTGWNLRSASIGAEGELLANTGSYLPFPEARIRQRFPGRADYLVSIEKAARGLIKDRLLLEQDLPDMVKAGGRIWDWTDESLRRNEPVRNGSNVASPGIEP